MVVWIDLGYSADRRPICLIETRCAYVPAGAHVQTVQKAVVPEIVIPKADLTRFDRAVFGGVSMAFPCKNELTYFEKLSQKQHRLFHDTPESGLPYSEVDMGEVRHNLLRMMDVFRQDPDFYEYQTRVQGDDTAGMREVSFFVPIETDRGLYQGVRVKIGRYWGFSSGVGAQGDDGYITIDIQDHSKA